MPRAIGVSFRILEPDPILFSRDSRYSPEVRLAVEFPSQPPAVRFENFLAGLSGVRHVRLEKKPPVSVSWTLSWARALPLAKSLEPFPEIARQAGAGLPGFSHDGFWELQGAGRRRFRWQNRTQIMGVLNVTPDSFSDGGRYLEPSLAAERALRMQEQGADWIDVGGESTRPGAKAVPLGEEKKRVLPVLRACAKALRIPLSVDTYKAEMARAAVGEGAQMVNDIGALRLDPALGRTLARLKVPVVLMHMQGKPRSMQKNPRYSDVTGEILAFFRDRLRHAGDCGIAAESILIDPGFGFGKNPWHNMEITRRLWEFKILGKPILLGPSRKSSLGFLLGGAPPAERVEATGAAVTAAVLKGADFVRVHDVQSMARMVKIADAIRYDRGLDR